MKHTDLIDAVIDQGVEVDQGRIYLFGSINDKNALKAIAGLRALERGGPSGPIEFVINSGGGDEDAGWAIFDAIRACPRKVITVGTGGVSSMAVLVLQAGDLRWATPSSRLLIHGGSYDFGKDTQQMKAIDIAKELKESTWLYAKAIAERAELKTSKVMGWCRRETYMSASEALELGLIDAITKLPQGKRL